MEANLNVTILVGVELMIRKRTTEFETIINLDGPEGNANCLLGTAVGFARDLRMDDDEIKPILSDMQSSDYKHLVSTFDKHFGKYCVLETSNEELL